MRVTAFRSVSSTFHFPYFYSLEPRSGPYHPGRSWKPY
jgi:hypothetical protein